MLKSRERQACHGLHVAMCARLDGSSPVALLMRRAVSGQIEAQGPATPIGRDRNCSGCSEI